MFEEIDEVDLRAPLNWKLWFKLFAEVKEHKKYFIIGIIAITLIAFLEAYFIRLIADVGLRLYVEALQEEGFIAFIFVLVGLAIVFGIFVKIFVWSVSRIEQLIYASLTTKAFNRLQELSYSFFDKYSVGWLIARTVNDASRLSEIISWGVVDAVYATFLILFILIIMALTDWRLALVLTLFIPLIVIISALFRRVVIKYSWRVRRAQSRVSSALNEGITGAKTSKTLVLESKNLREFSSIVDNFRKLSVKSSIINSVFIQIIAISIALMTAFIAYYGGNLVLSNVLEYAILFQFISFSLMFFEPIYNIARISNEMKHAQVSAERVFNIIAIKPDIIDRADVIEKYGDHNNPIKQNWEEVKGAVEFKNVTFKYGDGPTILDNFNLIVKPGMTVAIVGETGAGKSTIINLLSRFYEPVSGQVLIDGRDYKDRSINWLHSNLGYVMQTPHLFSGTVKENIRYGNLAADDQQVIAAARAANANEFIEKLENGYDTDVGENGTKLSQGQRQLIAFARAIIANPKLLILDEATSSIDTQTEQLIQKGIKNLLKGRTSFIVAHRLSTIISADLILVIAKGKIIESGNHQELIEKQGHFSKLYKNQFIQEQLKSLDFI
jgi:ATP-binding cassette, subfamily B, bacterial